MTLYKVLQPTITHIPILRNATLNFVCLAHFLFTASRHRCRRCALLPGYALALVLSILIVSSIIFWGMFYQGPVALPDAHHLCLPGLGTGCLLRWFAEHSGYIYNHT